MTPSQQDLVEALRTEFVPALINELAGLSIVVDRAILYGSRAYGCPREDSDVDVAVIVASEKTGKIRQVCRDVRKKMATPDIPWRRIEGNEFDINEIERMRRLTTFIHSKILTAGIVLYENPATADQRQAAAAAALSAIDAQRDAALGQLLKAKLLVASEYPDYQPRELIAEEAYTAACFSMWAVLISAGIDPSHLAIRWHLRRLLQLVIWTDPELEKLVPQLRWLPEKFNADADRNWPLGITEKIASRARSASSAFYELAEASIGWPEP